MLTDYHIHTPLCHHAEGEPAEYIRAAQAAGLAEIGFSDHNPMATQFDNWRMAPEDLPRYLAMIDQAQRDHADFPVRLGLECDYIPGYEDHIRWLARQADWDYLIGSVHYIAPDWEVDNPYPEHIKRWAQQPVEDVWERYFAAYTRMAASGLFDFLAHPDLVKKFGNRPEGDLSRFYTTSLEAIADTGAVLEVSTAGLRKAAREIYPSRTFLELAHARHIPIVINSDAHAPAEVAHEFAKAVELVKAVGYTSVTRFHKRQKTQILL
ncbi:histidinol phosphate phosphatase [Verrucomicrobia bacterium LW23]|nr:histidinol phosphate phosphatase [Verrucomicrobia bacterium LW23]